MHDVTSARILSPVLFCVLQKLRSRNKVGSAKVYEKLLKSWHDSNNVTLKTPMRDTNEFAKDL